MKNMTGVDENLVEKVLEKSLYHKKMQQAILMVVINGRRKAHVAMELNVTRQHVTRTVNDFLKKMQQKDKYLR